MKGMMKVLVIVVLLMCVVMVVDVVLKKEVFELGKLLVEQIIKIEIDLNDGEIYVELVLFECSWVCEVLMCMCVVVEQYFEQKVLLESVWMVLFNDQQVVNIVLI